MQTTSTLYEQRQLCKDNDNFVRTMFTLCTNNVDFLRTTLTLQGQRQLCTNSVNFVRTTTTLSEKRPRLSVSKTRRILSENGRLQIFSKNGGCSAKTRRLESPQFILRTILVTSATFRKVVFTEQRNEKSAFAFLNPSLN